ncbi:MAG: GyrI-like domain-containing protein [Anaerolineaceae bacterium]|nr:GyrI-like domain-containing protein [Anaerolineaceae bacterium]
MPKIEVLDFPKTYVAGALYHGKNENNEIPALWDILMQREMEITHRDTAAPIAFGINIMGPEWDETHVFDYIAGYPVTKTLDDLPEGMGQFEIPAGQYAVITCPNLASLGEAYGAIYNRWLPESEYKLDLSSGNFCFELYTEEFNPPAGSEKLYIYVPVTKK